MRVSTAFLCCLLAGCSSALVDLSSFSVTSWPSKANQVLASGDTVRLNFSDPVDQPSTQALLSISSVEGSAAGDLSWSGKTLTFTPVPPLFPAKRYNLEFSGQVTLTDGRRFSVVKQVPFFSSSAAPGLQLASYSPGNGATATVNAPLVLTFEQAVDPISFATGFSVSPTVPYTTVWSGGGTIVTVTPQAWSVNTLVSWQLSTAVKSATGLPLVFAVSHGFLTNADQTPPVIISLQPGVSAAGVWTAAGSDLNALQQGDGLLLTVSKPISLPSLSSALHLTPSVKGHWDAQNVGSAPYEYVFIPDDEWSPGTEYSLKISDLQDTIGNTLTLPYLVSFTPAIPPLQVTGITLTGVSSVRYGSTDLNCVNFFPTCSPSGVSGALQVALTLEFDGIFSVSDKAQFALLSFCQPLFPTEGVPLSTPTLVNVSFVNDSTMVLTYQGFSVGTAAAPDYYSVRIPGGVAGVRTQTGSMLKEDVWLHFVTGS